MSVPDLSVVVPVLNEEESLDELYGRLTAVLAGAHLDYELVLVDDGSSDRSPEKLRALQGADPRVVLVHLTRNFGHQVAITAGMDYARGQSVAVIDADLQDPPEVLLELFAKWREGFDVVFARRRRRPGDGVFKRASASLFYRTVQRLTSVDVPTDTGDFRLMSRRAVDALLRLRERNRFVRGLAAWVGYRQTIVEYDRASRFAGQTKYPLRKMLRFASDALVSFSTIPLKVSAWFGLFVSLCSFAYAVVAIYSRVVAGEALPGWASLMVAIVFLGGVQLLALGTLGEYVGRIYDEVKGRPLYLVADESRPPHCASEERRRVPH